MNFAFRRKRISGILVVVPAQERYFDEEMKNYGFPETRSRRKLKKERSLDVIGGVLLIQAFASPTYQSSEWRNFSSATCCVAKILMHCSS